MKIISLNQNKEDFKQWLGSLPSSEYALAGDVCACWLALWFESQGFYVWGVFPQRANASPGGSPYGASQEVFLDNPEYKDEFDESDRVELEDWACNFAARLDRKYFEPMKTCPVLRDQAMQILKEGVDR